MEEQFIAEQIFEVRNVIFGEVRKIFRLNSKESNKETAPNALTLVAMWLW